MAPLHTLTAAERRRYYLPDDEVRGYWLAGDWERLTPVLRTYATVLTPARMMLSGDEVDDVIAKVLIRAWRLAVVPDVPRAWVSTACRNLCLDVLKSVAHGERNAGAAPLDELEGRDPAPDAWIEEEERQQRQARLREAIRELPDLTRRCLVLMEFHKQSSAEVGQKFGIDPSAVRMRVTRGRKLLATIYARTGPRTPALPRRGRKPQTATLRSTPLAGVPREHGIVARAKLDLAGLT
jgi:RNA polymerase sigma factor (sigma-70 family)